MKIPRIGGLRPAPAVFSWLLGAGLCLVVATGCSDSSGAGAGGPAAAADESPAEDAIAVEVGRVTRGSMSALYSTSATLRADKQATVTARTQGVLKQLIVEEGDWVEEGQPLAVLEDDEQRIAFDQASATADIKRRAHERARSLHEQGLMSDEEYETTRREAVEARHTAELAELTLSRTVIRATFAGRIVSRHLDSGATVGDGSPVYDLADLDPLYADVQVPERQVAELEPGQTVRVWTDDDDEGAGEAVIERISPAVDPSTGTVKVTLAVRRAAGLRPGSFVRIGIVTDTHLDALLVPRSALVAEGRRWHLFRIKDVEGRPVAELIEVTRGYEERDQVEILGDSAERPLDQGDRIVVTGASSLSDGSGVRLMGEKAGRATEAADETVEQGVAA